VKHVVIVNHNAGSIHHGPNFRSYYVGRALVDRGLRVTIVCSSFSHKLTRLPVVDGDYSEEYVDGVRMIWLKMPRYRSSVQRLWNYFCFARRLRSLDQIVPESVDAVICSSPPPYWIWACRAFARKRNARLVFECRDLWPDVILETKRTAFLNPAVWLMMIAERTAYRSADAVVAVNPEVRSVMKDRGLAERQFHVIPNGVTFEIDEVNGELSPDLKARLPRAPLFKIAYAGSLSQVYGLQYLIEAARLLESEGVHFLIAGGGSDKAYLSQKAAGLSNVSFIGWVPKKELYAFLREADVAYAGLLNIRSFSIGSDSTKVFEYMKARLPVVHALGSNASVVSAAGAGIHIPPEDSTAIADAVLKLRDMSTAQREEMGHIGLSYLKKYRTYDYLGFKWKELLDP